MKVLGKVHIDKKCHVLVPKFSLLLLFLLLLSDFLITFLNRKYTNMFQNSKGIKNYTMVSKYACQSQNSRHPGPLSIITMMATVLDDPKIYFSGFLLIES